MDEGMEGKDLASEKKVEYFIAELKSLIRQCKDLKNTPVESNGYRVSFEPETGRYKIVFSNTGIVLAQENKEGFRVYAESIEFYNQLVVQAEEQGIATLERPAGLVEPEELEEYLKKQKEMRGKGQTAGDEENSGEENEEEKDDEKPELEEEKDEEKEEIANKYNVNSKHVIHVDLGHEKLTKDDRFKDLVRWAGEYDDLYVIPGEDEFTYKTVGRKKGEKQLSEIQTPEKQVHGKNPNITIKRIDGEQIEEIRPLAVYMIDNDSMRAIIRNKYGEREMLYCRREAGKEEYWGMVVPEADTKNVEQGEYEDREFLDSKYNSKFDLDKKAEELKRAQDLEKRGVPSEKEGVQLDEIAGSTSENREKTLEEIVEDLKSRDGIVDELTVPPGYYENKAEKILRLLEKAREEGTDLDYEQALEQVENEGQREQGGRTPEGRARRRE